MVIRRAVVVALVMALGFEGCVATRYPTMVPVQGYEVADAQRDRRECEDRAEDEAGSPLGAGLKVKVVSALAGAGTGAVLVLSAIGSTPGPVDPRAYGFAVGGGAALGLLTGSVVGTFLGVESAAQVARAREDLFARCMSGRGYQLQ